MIKGDPKKVLGEHHNVVLTDEMAKKYFGAVDAVGKTLELEINHKFEPFVVSGIAKRSPQNSSIQFNLLLSFSYYDKINPPDGWLNISYSTYFLVHPGADSKAIVSKMAKVFQARAGSEIEEAKKSGFNDKFGERSICSGGGMERLCARKNGGFSEWQGS